MKKNNNDPFRFEGFDSPNFTQTPNVVFDELAPNLTEAELRVLLYIIRRTFGFGKNTDAISLRQLTDGIKTKDGRILDYGTGMSRKGVVSGCQGLVDKGIINVFKDVGEDKVNEINVYSLRFKESGVVTSGNYGSNPSSEGVVTNGNPQEKVVQQKDLVELLTISESLKEVMKLQTTKATFDSLISGISVKSIANVADIEDDHHHSNGDENGSVAVAGVVIEVPDERTRDWLTNRLVGRFEQALKNLLQREVEVHFVTPHLGDVPLPPSR